MCLFNWHIFPGFQKWLHHFPHFTVSLWRVPVALELLVGPMRFNARWSWYMLKPENYCETLYKYSSPKAQPWKCESHYITSRPDLTFPASTFLLTAGAHHAAIHFPPNTPFLFRAHLTFFLFYLGRTFLQVCHIPAAILQANPAQVMHLLKVFVIPTSSPPCRPSLVAQ